MILPAPSFVDFFAGSGLVTQGVRHACEPVWSNDICAKKAAIYTANHGDGHFHLGSIEHVRGAALPPGDIVWASFPCQDLSLAGKMGGRRLPQRPLLGMAPRDRGGRLLVRILLPKSCHHRPIKKQQKP